MVENFWVNRKRNGNKCTYWNAIEERELNAQENSVCDFMRQVENQYMSINLNTHHKLAFEDMRSSLPYCCENVLKGYARCAVMTTTYVPIQEMLFSWNELSYEQANALWNGACYKGLHAYGQGFIRKGLNNVMPLSENMFAIHKNLEAKGVVLSDVYAEHLDWTKREARNVNVWDAVNSESISFRKQVIEAYPFLETKIAALHEPVKIAKFKMPRCIENRVLEKN